MLYDQTGFPNFKVHGGDLHQAAALVISNTFEYLAKLQSHHYERHSSQLHRCADMPIK